jgi:hypothetical protein
LLAGAGVSGGPGGREGGFETDFLPGDGVGEAEVLRVEEIAAGRRGGRRSARTPAGVVVERVAEEGGRGRRGGCGFDGDRPEWRLTANVVVSAARERTVATDFEALPEGLAAQTEPRRGWGTRPMGVRIS